MSRRSNVLARLRRRNAGAARALLGLCAVAYLLAGAAPCTMAAERHASAPSHEQSAAAASQLHEHEHGAHAGHIGSHDHGSAPPHDFGDRCRHCPPGNAGAASAPDDAHSTCFAFEDLSSVASPTKDAPQAAAPLSFAAAVTLPPPLASPRASPAERPSAAAAVPLNLRHCVFLI